LIFDIPNFISKKNNDTNELFIDNFFIDIVYDFNNYELIINSYCKIKIPILYINFERQIIRYDSIGDPIIDVRNIDNIDNIDPKEIIEINKNKLYLNSILIHKPSISDSTNGHYVLLYKCNDYWYKYDDQIKINKYIGLLENFNRNLDYTKNIVGLYYTG